MGIKLTLYVVVLQLCLQKTFCNLPRTKFNNNEFKFAIKEQFKFSK